MPAKKNIINQPDIETKCIAITKSGNKCSKSKKYGNNLFCGTHLQNKPDFVMILFSDIPFTTEIRFIDEDDYNERKQEYYTEQKDIIKQNTVKHKKEQQNKDTEHMKKFNDFINCKTCSICFTEMDTHDELIRCNNAGPQYKHLICTDCMLGHMKSLMTDGIASNDCAFNKSDGCHGIYCDDDFRKAIAEMDDEIGRAHV